MPRISDRSFPVSWLRLTALCICFASLTGCAAMRRGQDATFAVTGRLEKDVERSRFSVARGDDVIGQLAAVRVAEGDTLPDIARHFGVGINAIGAANPAADLWIPEAGSRVVLPLSFVLPDAPRRGIVVNLATKRLFKFKDAGTSLAVTTYPVGVGAKDRPTPTGQMHVARKAARPTWHVPASIAADHRRKGDILPAQVPPGPENPLGEYALYLSKSGYLIHGTNKPASVGLNATNGCLRLYPENIDTLFRETPVNTPVLIVNQPYLVGQRDGVVYLEAHTPGEGAGAGELERAYEKLRGLEKRSTHPVDWNKVREVQTQARGIPVPILRMDRGGGEYGPRLVEVEHPARLNGRPEVPELKLDAWYVLAADLRDEHDAQRLAAIINHQGPQIPARVLAKRDSYRVLAGPFTDAGEAREAAKRLKIDLELDGILIEPVSKG